MKIQLQSFLYKLSYYSRPNQPWVCGKHAQGYSCENGPDKKGVCRTEYECVPYRKNDSWVCTRGQTYGGQCGDGPLSDGQCCHSIVGCVPTMSMRKKRSLFVKWTAFFTVSVILLLLNSGIKAPFFSPGALSFKHARVEQCSDCHAVFDQGLVEWIKAAFSGNNMIDNSQKCLDCHEFGAHAFKSHGLFPEKLKAFSHNDNTTINKDNQTIACFTCHREHHGLDVDITAVDRENCAFCHDLDDTLFTQKHPQFDHYPYQKNNIIYDHFTHTDKYFYNRAGTRLLENAPDSCVSCHTIDSNGVNMLHGSYEQDCKACHNDLFEDAESFSVIEIPELAIEGLSDDIWPKDANGVLTDFMVLLLAKDPLFIDAISELDDYFDLTVLSKEKTLTLITAIKRLFYDIDKKGAITIKQRLANTFDCRLRADGRFENEATCKINESDLDALVTLVPVKLLCEGKQQWFPKVIKEEIDNAEISETVPSESLYCDPQSPLFDGATSTYEWMLDDFSLEYRATHHNDPFIKIWLNLTRHQMQHPIVEPIRQQIFKALISEDASVQCTKCHSIESTDNQNFVIKGMTKDNNSLTKKEFIKFQHNDHIKSQDKSICNECHHKNTQEGYLKSYEDYDPLTFVSNFVTKNKDCASCHKPSMLKNQCQTCHNYHISDASLSTKHHRKKLKTKGMLTH